MVLNKEEFKSWLNNPIVESYGCGQARCPSICPIASYLHSKGLNHVKVMAYFYEYTDDKGKYSYNLPSWARQFIGEIDQVPQESVPVWFARAILEKIKDEN